jgi:pSer/pThr/pTyr-binding forkhead associated (FHA) protein
MGDKPREKLPTQMFGSPFLPPSQEEGDNQIDPVADAAAVRGNTLPPPAPIQPKRPASTPTAARVPTLAERVAAHLERDDPSEARAIRASIVPPPPPPPDDEETARLSDISESIQEAIGVSEDDLVGMLEGADGSVPPLVVESIREGLDEPGDDDDITTVIAVGEEPKRIVDLPRPAEPEPAPEPEKDPEPEEAFCPSPDDIPTIPPPDASAVRACISEMRKVRNSQLFSIPEEEAKAPFIYRIDQFGSFRCHIAGGENILIGRSPDCDIVVGESEFVSAFHAEVRREGNACFVRDCNSLNNTWINDILVAPGEEREVFHMEKILLGGKEGITLFFVDQQNADKKRPQVLYASSGKGVKVMTEHEMRAPTVVVDPELLAAASASEPPPVEQPEPEPEPEPEEQVPDPPTPAVESEPETPAEPVVTPPPLSPPNDKKVDPHVAPTVPLPVDLPQKLTPKPVVPVPVKPEPKPEAVVVTPPPPINPPNKATVSVDRTSLIFWVFTWIFIIAFGVVVVVTGKDKAPAESVAPVAVATTETAPTPAEPAPTPVDMAPVEPEGQLVVEDAEVEDLSAIMNEPMAIPEGWVPVDPDGPLAAFIGGRKTPREVSDCLPKSNRPLPELDVIRCCEYLGSARLRTECVFAQVAQVLRTEGGI